MSACAGITLLFAAATWHPGTADKYEAITPGISARCNIDSFLTPEAGVYRNSSGRPSAYVGVQMQTPVPRLSVMIGSVTGYVAGPTLAAAMVIAISERHELVILPKAEFRGYSGAWAITWRYKFRSMR